MVPVQVGLNSLRKTKLVLKSGNLENEKPRTHFHFYSSVVSLHVPVYSFIDRISDATENK